MGCRGKSVALPHQSFSRAMPSGMVLPHLSPGFAGAPTSRRHPGPGARTRGPSLICPCGRSPGWAPAPVGGLGGCSRKKGRAAGVGQGHLSDNVQGLQLTCGQAVRPVWLAQPAGDMRSAMPAFPFYV